MSGWTSNSGAKRFKKMPFFHLIPLAALACLADRLEMGAEKYGENNWQKALSPVDMDFMKDGLNHMQHHLSSLMNGEFEEDTEWGHLGAIMFGCMMRACALEMQGDLTELHDLQNHLESVSIPGPQMKHNQDGPPFDDDPPF